MHTRDALEKGETTDRVAVLAAWWESQYFSPQERAALALAEQVTRLSVPDARAWDDGSLTDEQVSAISWLAIVMNAWNRVAITSTIPSRPDSGAPEAVKLLFGNDGTAELEGVHSRGKDHVAQVTLIGPGKGNAMGPDFWDELPASSPNSTPTPSVRAVVLAGSGKHFSFGLDLPAMSGGFGACSPTRPRPGRAPTSTTSSSGCSPVSTLSRTAASPSSPRSRAGASAAAST